MQTERPSIGLRESIENASGKAGAVHGRSMSIILGKFKQMIDTGHNMIK